MSKEASENNKNQRQLYKNKGYVVAWQPPSTAIFIFYTILGRTFHSEFMTAHQPENIGRKLVDSFGMYKRCNIYSDAFVKLEYLTIFFIISPNSILNKVINKNIIKLNQSLC